MTNIIKKNIACNLIYNNGGEGVLVGFEKHCDIENIIYNVKYGSRRWCNQPECPCKKFYDKKFNGQIDNKFPCNESFLFVGWEWSPGGDFETQMPFRIKHSGAGKIAILTTKFRECKESERNIIGFLKIEDIKDNHLVIGVEKQSLRLSMEEAKELSFWNYHQNKKNNSVPRWDQGRFRYLEDEQVAAILHDLKSIVQNNTTQSMITELIENDFPNFANKRPNITGALKEDIVKKIRLKRKYGKGGESKEHKQLKEFIAKNPEKIGLNKNEVKPIVEHSFISGDLVDILFAPTSSRSSSTVVEIELDNVEPGIHQAIKYRVLRCSQLGLPLTDKSVRATVVAWKLKLSEKLLCKKYDIEFYEIKL